MNAMQFPWYSYPLFALWCVICFVWALSLVGAWCAKLPNCPDRLKKLALDPQYAGPIMKRMSLQLVGVVSAFGLGAVGVINSVRAEQLITTAGATLICRVQVPRDQTDPEVKEGIKLLASLPNRLQPTLKAYDLYLSGEVIGPDSLQIILMGTKRSAFDLRLEGIIHSGRSWHLESLSNAPPEQIVTELDEARKKYEAALAKLTGGVPGELDRARLSAFGALVSSELASVRLGLAENLAHPDATGNSADDYLRMVLSELIPRVREPAPNTRPSDFINAIEAIAVQMEREKDPAKQDAMVQDALNVVSCAASSKELHPDGKDLIEHELSQWDVNNKHMRPLVEAYHRRNKTSWPLQIAQRFHESPAAGLAPSKPMPASGER